MCHLKLIFLLFQDIKIQSKVRVQNLRCLMFSHGVKEVLSHHDAVKLHTHSSLLNPLLSLPSLASCHQFSVSGCSILSFIWEIK